MQKLDELRRLLNLILDEIKHAPDCGCPMCSYNAGLLARLPSLDECQRATIRLADAVPADKKTLH